jgi:hypothetical protein
MEEGKGVRERNPTRGERMAHVDDTLEVGNPAALRQHLEEELAVPQRRLAEIARIRKHSKGDFAGKAVAVSSNKSLRITSHCQPARPDPSRPEPTRADPSPGIFHWSRSLGFTTVGKRYLITFAMVASNSLTGEIITRLGSARVGSGKAGPCSIHIPVRIFPGSDFPSQDPFRVLGSGPDPRNPRIRSGFRGSGPDFEDPDRILGSKTDSGIRSGSMDPPQLQRERPGPNLLTSSPAPS